MLHLPNRADNNIHEEKTYPHFTSIGYDHSCPVFCLLTIIQAGRFKNGPLFNPVFTLTQFFKHSVIFAQP